MVARNTRSAPGVQVLIVPSDSTILEGGRKIVCLTAGNLVLQGREGTSVTYALTAGQSLDFSPTKVMAATTGTYVCWR